MEVREKCDLHRGRTGRFFIPLIGLHFLCSKTRKIHSLFSSLGSGKLDKGTFVQYSGTRILESSLIMITIYGYPRIIQKIEHTQYQRYGGIFGMSIEFHERERLLQEAHHPALDYQSSQYGIPFWIV